MAEGLVVKMPFFFYSDYGSTLFLAKRLKAEGHPVLLYIKDEAAQDVGKGLVPKTTNPVPPTRSLVMFDGVGHGTIGKELRKKGHAVIGGNPLDKSLEADRPEGAQIMRRHGIQTPKTYEFRSVPTAIKFLDGQEGHWFVKAIGTDTPEASTYDAPVEELQRYLRAGGDQVKHFQLSQKVAGTELSINGWFDGTRFVPPFDCTLEEKRFATGNLGPRTGCESNLVWFHQGTFPDDLLSPLVPLLQREGYVGPLDLNALYDEDGIPLGLEWTARLGFDALQAWTAIFDNKVGDQLAAFAHGELPQWESSEDLSVTLRLSMVPPYPLWEPKVAQKYKGRPLDPRWLTDTEVTVDDVMLGPDGPQMAGRDGYIGTVGATGTDLAQLKTMVLDKAKTMRVPNKHYRTDPLSRATKDLTALATMDLLGHPALMRQFGKKAA